MSDSNAASELVKKAGVGHGVGLVCLSLLVASSVQAADQLADPKSVFPESKVANGTGVDYVAPGSSDFVPKIGPVQLRDKRIGKGSGVAPPVNPAVEKPTKWTLPSWFNGGDAKAAEAPPAVKATPPFVTPKEKIVSKDSTPVAKVTPVKFNGPPAGPAMGNILSITEKKKTISDAAADGGDFVQKAIKDPIDKAISPLKKIVSESAIEGNLMNGLVEDAKDGARDKASEIKGAKPFEIRGLKNFADDGLDNISKAAANVVDKVLPQ